MSDRGTERVISVRWDTPPAPRGRRSPGPGRHGWRRRRDRPRSRRARSVRLDSRNAVKRSSASPAEARRAPRSTRSSTPSHAARASWTRPARSAGAASVIIGSRAGSSSAPMWWIVGGDSMTRYSDWMPETNASETSAAWPRRSKSRYGVDRLTMRCADGCGRIFSNRRSGVVSSTHSLETIPSSAGGAGRSS